MKASDRLTYNVEDNPSFITLSFLGLQFALIVTAFLLLPVIVMQDAHVDNNVAAGVISTAMLVAGLTGILQVFKRGIFGSGYLILSSPNPVYIAPSIIAIQMGGLPLVFGMTIFAGCIQAIIAPFFKRLQRFFPAEIGGLIMALIGMQIGTLEISDLIDSTSIPVAHPGLPLLISFFIFAALLIMSLWGSSFFRLYALIISLVVGYFLIYITDCLSQDTLSLIAHAPWFALPSFPAFQLAGILTVV